MANVIQVIVNGLLIGAVYGLVAMGLSLVFGVMKIINFAHGDFLMVAMYVGYTLVVSLGGDATYYVLVVVAVMFLLGILIYRLLMARLMAATDTAQLLVTYGLGIILQNLALMLWNSDYRSVNASYGTSSFHLGEVILSKPRLLAFAASVITGAVLLWIIRRTRIGKAIRATAINPRAAELMGINTQRVFAVAFGIGVGVLGVAGTTLLPYLYVYPTLGNSFTLISFVVAVLGGLGNVWGTFAAGMIIGLAESATATWISGDLPMLVAFAVFVITLMFRPSGLFGRHTA